MSIRRGCCCGGCPEEIEVTFIGVSPCGCGPRTGGSVDYAWVDDLNGVYTLSLQNDFGGTCFYQLGNAGEFRTTLYTDAACNTLFFGSDSQYDIFVEIDKATSMITEVRVELGIGTSGGIFIADVLAADFGDAVSNEHESADCNGTTGPLAHSGTATVSLP